MDSRICQTADASPAQPGVSLVKLEPPVTGSRHGAATSLHDH